MALTSAERKKRYIEKQKLTNLEEYKQKQKLKNKLYYASKVKHIDISLIEPSPEILQEKPEFILLEPIKKRINPINKSSLNKNTITLYLKTIKKIYFDFHKHELRDDSDILNLLSNKPYNINNISSQFDFIKSNIYDLIKSHKEDDIRILYSVITRFKNFSTTVKQLYPYILRFQNIYNTNRSNKIIDDSIKKQINLFSFDKEFIIETVSTRDDLSQNEKLIFILLTLFPTRRPVDYRKMKFSSSEPQSYNKKAKYEDKYNYYYNDFFYFNITKNKKIQKFKIDAYLSTFINNLGFNNDDFLLSNNGSQFSQNQLSKLIMNLTFKIYDISISALEIRRLYATHLKSLFDSKIISEKEHREFSDMMNHNYEENKKYSY
jgi:hypothetical protein